MKTIKLSDNLWLHEYIPEQMYKEYESKGKLQHLIWMLDDRLIQIDQALRNKFGSVTINNWINGGNRDNSGLRPPGSPYYKPASQHSFGRASDKLFSNATADEVRQEIKQHQVFWMSIGLTAIEDNVSWVHSYTRANATGKLLIFNP